jgi:Skp family chaperone for outer membrane proteins
MKVSHTLLLALALVIALGAMTLTDSHAQSAGSAGPTRVGVCNIVEVFREYQRAQDLTQDLEKRRAQLAAEREKRNTRAEELRTQMEGLRAGSDAHEQALKQLEQQIVENRVWFTLQQAALLREHKRLTEEMYKEITSAIAEVANRQGFDLIVQLEPKEMQAENVEQFIQQIDRRKVLYNKDGIDITAAVLQQVNETYRISNP